MNCKAMARLGRNSHGMNREGAKSRSGTRRNFTGSYFALPFPSRHRAFAVLDRLEPGRSSWLNLQKARSLSGIAFNTPILQLRLPLAGMNRKSPSAGSPSAEGV